MRAKTCWFRRLPYECVDQRCSCLLLVRCLHVTVTLVQAYVQNFFLWEGIKSKAWSDVSITTSGGSRKKIFGGGAGPSSFGRQPRLSEITIEAISGVLPKFRWVYARNMAPSSERWTWAPPVGSGAKPRPPTHSRHISGPQNPSSRNNALQNQPKIWGAWARFGGGLCPSLKPPLITTTPDFLPSFPFPSSTRSSCHLPSLIQQEAF